MGIGGNPRFPPFHSLTSLPVRQWNLDCRFILASFTIDLADTGDGMDMKKKHMFAGILNIHNLHYHTLPTLIRKFVNCVHDWVIQYLVVLSSGAFTSIKWAFKCVQLVKSH